jgi:phytoene/squalene synthetase
MLAVICYQAESTCHRRIYFALVVLEGIWLLPTDCRLPILVAGRLYRRILTAIKQMDYDVLRFRAGTNFAEKVQEAVIAFTLDRLWRRGEALSSTETGMLYEG